MRRSTSNPALVQKERAKVSPSTPAPEEVGANRKRFLTSRERSIAGSPVKGSSHSGTPGTTPAGSPRLTTSPAFNTPSLQRSTTGAIKIPSPSTTPKFSPGSISRAQSERGGWTRTVYSPRTIGHTGMGLSAPSTPGISSGNSPRRRGDLSPRVRGEVSSSAPESPSPVSSRNRGYVFRF